VSNLVVSSIVCVIRLLENVGDVSNPLDIDFAFEVVGRRIEVLVQSMLATKGPVAIITLKDVGLGAWTMG
jgi:hypothetical protein